LIEVTGFYQKIAMSEIKPGEPPISKQHKIELLRKVCTVFNNNDIDYFLTCGTLLGYMREGDFIEWDLDIDLGVFDINNVMRLKDNLEKKGLRCEPFYSEHTRKMSLKLHIQNTDNGSDPRLLLDIFEFKELREGIYFWYVYNNIIFELVRRTAKALFNQPSKESFSLSTKVKNRLNKSKLPNGLKGILNQIIKWIQIPQHGQGIHIFEPFTCLEKEWCGINIKIPSRPVDHLRLLFGDQWQDPNPYYTESINRQINLRRVRL
jgi:phosphorylcholine metabolism protein LicD